MKDRALLTSSIVATAKKNYGQCYRKKSIASLSDDDIRSWSSELIAPILLYVIIWFLWNMMILFPGTHRQLGIMGKPNDLPPVKQTT